MTYNFITAHYYYRHLVISKWSLPFSDFEKDFRTDYTFLGSIFH